MADLTFTEWLAKLDATAREWDGSVKTNLSEETGAECWKDYFDDGYSPEDALREDWSYG